MTKSTLILGIAFALIGPALVPALAQVTEPTEAAKQAIDEQASYLHKRADLEAKVRDIQIDLWALRAKGADQAEVTEKAADLQAVFGEIRDLDQANAGSGRQAGAAAGTPCPFGYPQGTGRGLGIGLGGGPGGGYGVGAGRGSGMGRGPCGMGRGNGGYGRGGGYGAGYGRGNGGGAGMGRGGGFGGGYGMGRGMGGVCPWAEP
jgi:hypothetical protein